MKTRHDTPNPVKITAIRLVDPAAPARGWGVTEARQPGRITDAHREHAAWGAQCQKCQKAVVGPTGGPFGTFGTMAPRPARVKKPDSATNSLWGRDCSRWPHLPDWQEVPMHPCDTACHALTGVPVPVGALPAVVPGVASPATLAAQAMGPARGLGLEGPLAQMRRRKLSSGSQSRVGSFCLPGCHEGRGHGADGCRNRRRRRGGAAIRA